MNLSLSIAVLAGSLSLAIAPAVITGQQPPAMGHTSELVIKAMPPKIPAKLTITSSAFKKGADIPYENTQARGNIFPGLSWSKGPEGTRSYAVIVQGESLNRPGAPKISVTLADFVSAAKRKFGALVDEFLKLNPASSDEEAALQNNESVRDNARISTFLWALDWKQRTNKPVDTYFWTHRPTSDPGGAHHGSEILFAFNNLHLRDQPWTGEDRRVADTISSYWANYVATGNPNGPGLPKWPAFDPKSPTAIEIDDHYGPIPLASQPKLAFWKRFFQTQQPW
jgi:carboxylesterase type B